MTVEEIESYNDNKFHHICKTKFHDVDDSDDDSNHDSNDDNDGEEFNIREFHGDAAGLDDLDDDYYDNHDDEFGPKKFHGNAVELDIDFDYDDYNEEFNGMRFHGVSKNHERVHDHFHYTGKYEVAAHGICNIRYKIPKETHVLFHNRSKYDYHFIIKQLSEEFKGQFQCL